MKDVFFSLLNSAVFGTPIDEKIKTSITPDILVPLYKLSKRHDLAHLVGEALDKNGLFTDDSEVKKRFLSERDMAVYRYGQQKYEYNRICNALEKAEIRFIPLKGSVLRDYYPAPWMRTSCDIDILVKPEDLQHAIDVLGTELNYKYDGTGKFDANMFSPSGVHLELRYNPSAVSEHSKKVLSTIWDNVVDKNEYKLMLTNEMFYFYHMEHMAGHFVIGGCGVRFFLDACILNRTLNFDTDLKRKLLADSGLDVFADSVEKLCECWFGTGAGNQLLDDMEAYVLYAGIYGRMETRVAIDQKEKGSRFHYLISRVFPPYKELKYMYPRLQNCPILYPFYIIKRWFRLLDKDAKKKALREFNESASTAQTDEGEKINALFKDLKL